MAELRTDFSLLTRLRDAILGKLPDGVVEPVSDVIVDQSFSVVRLRSGHLGMAMNYAMVTSGRRQMQEAQKALGLRLEGDASLLTYLWDFDNEMDPALRGSLMTALLSALTQTIVNFEVSGFKSIEGGLSISQLVQPGDTVTVIGLGGYLLSVLRDEKVKRVCLADLYAESDSARKEIAQLRVTFPRKQFDVTSGAETESFLRASQIACLTASALSNGTLSHLLASSGGCRHVVLQGKSGNVLPGPLFESGITHITTYEYPMSRWAEIKAWCDRNPDGDFAAYLDANFHNRVHYVPT